MKKFEEWDYFIDDFGVYKENEDGDFITDEDDNFVEVDEKTPITYGMLKQMMTFFVDNLKHDLEDLARRIPED